MGSVRASSGEDLAKFEAKLRRLAGAAMDRHLVAAGLPAAAAEVLDAAKAGVMWHPGVAVRAVARGDVSRSKRAGLAESLAETLAEAGYRVDPEARLTVELVPEVTGETKGPASRVKYEDVSESLRRSQRLSLGEVWFEKVDLYEISVGRVCDEGRLFETPMASHQRPVTQGAGESAV